MIDQEIMDFDELSDQTVKEVADLVTKLGIKDFDQMVDDTLNDIVSADVGITNTIAGSVVRTIVESLLYNNDALNYYISYVYSALGLDDASGENLDRLIAILGVTRNPATYATTYVTFSTGDEPYKYDIIIPTGQIVSSKQDADGTIYEFEVVESVIIPAGTKTVNVLVQSLEPGHIYLPIGSISVLSESIIGIDNISNSSIIDSGTDAESDDSLRERTKDISSSYGKCTDNAIILAVKSLDGVTNCIIKDQINGVGTTGVVVATQVVPPPDSLKSLISSTVAGVKASGINASIIYPSITNIEISVNVTGLDVDKSDIIIQSIVSYISSLHIGQTFMIKQMERKVLNAIDDNNVDNDDIDISTILPTDNITADDTHILRTNKITINGVVHNVV